VIKALALALFLALAAGSAFAVDPSERLADPALEARARAIGAELRCLVCQNQSIDDSNADLAHDLRVLIRERLAAGDSDQQVLQFMVRRYGDFILLRPPVKPATYLLWYGPFGLLVLGAIGVVFHLRRRGRKAVPVPAPLSADEERRLKKLVADDGGG
jgi:cytochrome c-type biogenesis protein CcmH